MSDLVALTRDGWVDFVVAPNTFAYKLAMTLRAQRSNMAKLRMEWWRFVHFVNTLHMHGYDAEVYSPVVHEIVRSIKSNVQIQNDIDVLKPWQQTALEALGSRWMQRGIGQRGFILHLDMGLGKTLTIISFLRWLRTQKPSYIALIVVPAYLRYNWQNEFDKWWNWNGASDDINLIVTKGGKDKLVINKGVPNIFIVSYTSLGKYLGQLPKNIDVLVLDESHKIKNPKAIQTRNALWFDADFSILSTGTLFTNYPHEIWAQYYRVIKHTKWYSSSYMKYYDWQYRYCYVQPNPFGGVRIVGINKYLAWELQARLRPIHLRITKEDVLDLDAAYIVLHKINTSIDVPEEEKAKILKLMDEGKNVPEYMTQWLRRVALEKVPYIRNMVVDLVEQHEQVLVFGWHNDVIDELEVALQKKVRVGVIRASDSARKRWETLEAFKRGEYDVLLGTIGVLGEGLNVPEARHVVFAQLPFTASALRQAIDRARRLKPTGEWNNPIVHVVLGVNEKTDIELAMWRLIKRKEKAFDLVFNEI